jgi:hypothetical protein
MPRSNRSRRRRGADREHEPIDLERALQGMRRTVDKRDGQWHVQPLKAGHAHKTYACPGCGLDIQPGVAHVVTWRADAIMGEADALASRRHWHEHCWRIHP